MKRTCANCGKPIHRGPGSLPVGQARCRACRASDPKPPFEHGTRRGYRERGCRCRACRKWNARAHRSYASEVKAATGKSLYGKYRPANDVRDVVPRQVREYVYERDEWLCQLCRMPVDRDLDPNDRMAATLDHIECRSWSLIPDHSAKNLRLAHRACNSRRRDGREAELECLR